MTGPRRSRRPKNTRSCHDRALGLLAVRPRSRRELQSRLERAGFDHDEVQEELDRLTAVGLVDDRAFAQAFAEHALRVRLAGRRAVAAALAAKGVERATIEGALSELDTDEETRALELARGRVRQLGGLAPEAAQRRLVAFLARRGYEPGMARRAASSALGVDGDPTD